MAPRSFWPSPWLLARAVASHPRVVPAVRPGARAEAAVPEPRAAAAQAAQAAQVEIPVMAVPTVAPAPAVVAARLAPTLARMAALLRSHCSIDPRRTCTRAV